MGTDQAFSGPLTLLAGILHSTGPPRLSEVVTPLAEAEEYGEFIRLVEDYLPQHRQRILGGKGIGGKVANFGALFEEQYFPLAYYITEGDVTSFSELVNLIPIQVYGQDYEDYHELHTMRPGIVLASLLVGFEEALGLEGEGIRITLLESGAALVPQELLARVPEKGYPLDFLEEALAGSPHEGLLAHARHLCYATDNTFLKYSMEELYAYGCHGTGLPNWDYEVVEGLTEEWLEAKEILDKQTQFWEWLEEDQNAHFNQLVYFLEAKRNGTTVEPVDDRQLRLPLGTA